MIRSKRCKITYSNPNISPFRESLLGGKKKKRITLVTVDLQLKHDSLGAYIGRKAHIEFLSNVELAKMIMSRYSYAFDL